MIIVTTTKGTHLLNDAEVSHIIHDKENATVYVYGDTFGELNIPDVTDVYYTANAPIEWRDKGNAFLKNEQIIDHLKEERDTAEQRVSFYRWSYMIFDRYLSDIEATCKNQDYSDTYVRKEVLETVENCVRRIKDSAEERKSKGQML